MLNNISRESFGSPFSYTLDTSPEIWYNIVAKNYRSIIMKWISVNDRLPEMAERYDTSTEEYIMTRVYDHILIMLG